MGHFNGFIVDPSPFLALLQYGYVKSIYIINRTYQKAIQFRKVIKKRG